VKKREVSGPERKADLEAWAPGGRRGRESWKASLGKEARGPCMHKGESFIRLSRREEMVIVELVLGQ